MHKLSAEVFLGCGIDVSAAQLVVALQTQSGGHEHRCFPNHARGHQALILWLQKAGRKVRVCLEATGLYSLDLALALHQACGIEVAVLNPKLVNRFAATLCRNKTDPADAQVLAEYARRMPFQLWQPPRAVALQLRAVTRHIAALSNTRERAIACTLPRLLLLWRAVSSRISNAPYVISITASKNCVRQLWHWSSRTRSCVPVSGCC